MTSAADIAAKLGQELADYLYPLRDWMVDSEGCDADVAIVGSGRRAQLLSYALRRERITRQLCFADSVADLVEMYGALGEPQGGLPHLDLTGSEFWVPEASFGAWLAGWQDQRQDTPAGTALRSSWSRYLEWLAGVLEVQAPAPTAIVAIELDTDRVRIVQADGVSRTVRRLIFAGPAGDLAPSDVPLGSGLAPKPVTDTSLLPASRSLEGQRVLVMGEGLEATDWAITALADGGARAVVQVGGILATSPAENAQAIPRIVRHPFRALRPAQRDTLRAAAASVSPSLPPDWARRLAVRGEQYGFVRASGEVSLSELLLRQGFNPDLVVVPHRPRSAHVACEVRLASGGVCQLGEIFRHLKVDEAYRLTAANGTVLPLIAFGTSAVPAAGPRALDCFLARYGLVDALETISCDFFVADEGALFASFQSFRTSETFGGKLMETKP